MEIKELLQDAAIRGASDIFLIGGLPLTYKIEGKQLRVNPETRLMPSALNELITELYAFVDRDITVFTSGCTEDDFSFAIPGCGRYRANVFRQRGSMSAVIRLIKFGVPDPAQYNIPKSVLSLAGLKDGLVLVTGPAGSGKTSTIACIIDEINKNYEKTIITMEDPIEIIHNHKKSIVIQREISTDTESFMSALRASLRESPDVLLVGEMRDAETIEVAMTAAETGQLLFSSLHTRSAADTVDRIVDSFSDKQQPQIRAQLSRVLRSVICQKLIPATNGKLVPAYEIMHVTPAIRNLIREGKTYQFNSFIQEGSKLGMCSMNASLLRLYNDGLIDADTALANSEDPVSLEKKLK